MSNSLKKLEQLTLEQILKLREEHPYFSLLNVTSAKKLKNSPYFDHELSTASFFVAERNQFRKYVESDTIHIPETAQSIESPLSIHLESPKELDKSPSIDFSKASFTFNQWLNVFASNTSFPASESESQPQQDDLDKLILQSAQSVQFLNESLKQETSYSKGLDSFLASQKQLHKIKKSQTPENDAVTETLAKLYIAQGKKDKAKFIFEKLLLIYPEKNTYFAQQIQNLK